MQRRFADGVLTPYPKTIGSRRRVPLTARAVDALDRLPPRIDTVLVFPAARGGHIGLDGWRTRHWYPALEGRGSSSAARITSATRSRPRRWPAGLSIFELARVMGTSVKMIDRTYGHLARDSEAAIRARLDARGRRSWRCSGDGRERMTDRRQRDNPAWLQAIRETGATGLEPAASGVTGRRSNQLSYAPGRPGADV